MRVQIKFKKLGSIRFISHHNVMKLFERAVRRAEIPVKMSKGFNPRPKIAYPLALPVGIEGVDEKLEIDLSDGMQIAKIESRLKRQLPENIQITSAKQISSQQKTFVTDVTYTVSPNEGKLPEVKKITEFMSKDVINTQRQGKKKVFNLRPSIMDITTNLQSIDLNLKMTPKGMARPEEVLFQLGLEVGKDYELSKVVRTKVNLSSSNVATC